MNERFNREDRDTVWWVFGRLKEWTTDKRTLDAKLLDVLEKRLVNEVEALSRGEGSVPLEVLETSRYTLNAVARALARRHRERTVGTVEAMCDAQLLMIPGMGKKRLEELKEAIRKFREEQPNA